MVIVFAKQEIQEAITFWREHNKPFKYTRHIMILVCRSSVGQNIEINASLQYHNAPGTLVCHLKHVKCACFTTYTFPCLY